MEEKHLPLMYLIRNFHLEEYKEFLQLKKTSNSSSKKIFFTYLCVRERERTEEE